MDVEIEQSPIKVMISYCQGKFSDWVETLAARLRTDGIDVSLDKWELCPGNDLISFMEKMSSDSTIKRVLVVCTEEYRDKANFRRGGVGAEAQIIASKIYNHPLQEKYIPIVLQKDEEGKPFLPTFLERLFYIDMSHPDQQEEKYPELLCGIRGEPFCKKPTLGKSLPIHFVPKETTNASPNISTSSDPLDHTAENLISIGPEIIAHGKLIKVHGNEYKFELSEFLLGDFSELRKFSSDFEQIGKYNRYLVLEQEGEGWLIHSPPRIDRTDEKIQITVYVQPQVLRRDASTLGGDVRLDISKAPYDLDLTFTMIKGIEYVPQLIAVSLSCAQGSLKWNYTYGSRIVEFYARFNDKILLDRLLKLDLARLAYIPYLSSIHPSTEVTTLDIIEEIHQASFLKETLTDRSVSVSIRLKIKGIGLWEEVINISMPAKLVEEFRKDIRQKNSHFLEQRREHFIKQEKEFHEKLLSKNS